MDPRFFLLLFSVSASSVLTVAQPPSPTSHITVTGSVFCDVCYNNSFTKYSYFLSGVDVHLACKFQANGLKTREQITFSVNRTTNRYGVYRLDIPSIDGVDCVDGPAIESFCEASLIRSSLPNCNVPGVSTTNKEITVKSRSTNLCVYSVSTLSYKPSKKNSTLCGNYDDKLEDDKVLSDSLNSSKFFLPYFPWPLPPLATFPSLPPLPPLPPFHFLPMPPLPKPPGSNPPPPLPFDPRTWIPVNPFLIPPPPGFDIRDPRTWMPPFPPYPPQNP